MRQGRLWWWFTNFRTDVIVLHVPPWEGEPDGEMAARFAAAIRGGLQLGLCERRRSGVPLFKRQEVSRPRAPQTGGR